MMDKAVSIRRVKAGDENSLAYVQTESWKEAFREIVSADILSQCTEIERAAEMYKMLLAENKGNGYILELDGRPHCLVGRCQRGEHEGICGTDLHSFAQG